LTAQKVKSAQMADKFSDCLVKEELKRPPKIARTVSAHTISNDLIFMTLKKNLPRTRSLYVASKTYTKASMICRFSLGDTEVPFSMQSCSKPFTYAICLNELGSEVDPGRTFYSAPGYIGDNICQKNDKR
jgi:hypothetical protein